ncbi:Uncharacterized protein Adt_12166 [Abeliophyllum distichum]|uniref:Uncharacterized protein n=1 Tax=Abeliophyllum distichum TaxID=126358 RepID=A0ABD1UPZ0_9LAMI
MTVPLPLEFEQPKKKKYDGSSDPIHHLRVFVDLTRLRAIPDAIMCRAFLPTLRQKASDWVATILPKLIRTFDNFASILLHTLLAANVQRNYYRLDVIDPEQRRATERFHYLVQYGHVGNQRSADVYCSHCHDEWNSSRPFKMCHFLKTHRI